jgi:3-deoxy-D-manno-octulosonic-acid transferase
VTAPLIGTLYRALTWSLAPVLRLWLLRRAYLGKEVRSRLAERFGISSIPRPDGRLIWIHAASVGETMSILPLIAQLTLSGSRILLTTGTRTSAELAAARLPKGAIHQFVPLDVPQWLGRFLDHWQPDAGLIVEAEFWPNLIFMAHDRAIPLGLVNGRLSAKSYQSWTKVSGFARYLLSCFSVLTAQDGQSARRLESLAQKPVITPGNLKFDAPALPDDPASREALLGRIAGRPVWLAASIHPGEDEIVLSAAKSLQTYFPDLLTLIAPRHPERGPALSNMARAAGFNTAQRSAGELITPATRIYIADTLGELGLFYRLAPISFIGGSMIPHGGQNPLEAARLGSAVMIGPNHWNQKDAVALIGALVVPDGDALIEALRDWLTRPDQTQIRALAQKEAVDSANGAVIRTLAALTPVLGKAMDA